MMTKIAIAIIASCQLLVGCVFVGSPQAQLPTEVISARTNNAKQLVIVLPGLGDRLAVLKNSKIAQAIQRSMPDAEVVLVELSLSYYMEGRAIQRLHDQIVQPASQRGIRDIYLAGASMGGMGVLMYEHDHPNEMRGLILMAPYMGEASMMNEIESAGGLQAWDPGPSPAQINRDNTPREEWRVVKSWISHRERTQNVWLISGQSDRLRPAAEIVAKWLPDDHFISPPGGHSWKVWRIGADAVFEKIAGGK